MEEYMDVEVEHVDNAGSDVENLDEGYIQLSTIQRLPVLDMDQITDLLADTVESVVVVDPSDNDDEDEISITVSTPVQSDIDHLVNNDHLIPRAWKDVTPPVRDLFYEMKALLNTYLVPSSPATFINVLFTQRKCKVRRKILHELLQLILDDEEWRTFHQNLPKQKQYFNKLIDACRQWGISDNEGIVIGRGFPQENLYFWEKVIKVVRRLSEMPDSARIMLNTEFSLDQQNKLSWKEMIEKGCQAAMEQTHCVTLSQLSNTEKLLDNGLLDLDNLNVISKGILETLKQDLNSGTKSHHKNNCPMKSHKDCVKMKKMTQALYEYFNTYHTFMTVNQGFARRKMSFIVFHSDYAFKFMEEFHSMRLNVLRLGAEFFNADDEFVDNPSWIP